MLVVQRYIGERIIIRTPDEDIVVTLVDIRDQGRARIGVHAPGHVRIYREEIMNDDQALFNRKGSK